MFFSLNHILLISIKSNNGYYTKKTIYSKNDQEQLLEDFYNNLGDDEDTFLGHHFVKSDVDDESDFSDDESDGVCRPLPDPETAVTPIGRSHKCAESIVGIKTYKTDREKMNSKLKTKCRVCLGFICKKHQFKLELTCKDCFEK